MAECLRDVCRLCGGSGASGIDRRNPHSKEKYRDVILKALDVDVTEDINSVYPPYVCHSCFKKLDRWWKATKQKKMKTCNIDVVSFCEHRCTFSCAPYPVRQDLSSVCNNLITLAQQHKFLTWCGADRLKIMQFGDSGYPEVELNIFSDISWKVDVCGVNVAESGCTMFLDVPSILTTADVVNILGIFQEHSVCIGNQEYLTLTKSREGPSGQIPFTITGRDFVQMYPYQTIRHQKCHLLIGKSKSRCDMCQLFRVDLCVLTSRLKEPEEITTASTVRNDVLSNKQLQQKIKLMKAENKTLKRRSRAIQEKMRVMVAQDSVPVSDQKNQYLHQAMEECESAFHSSVPEGSPAALLWEQQKKSFEKGKGMRWHPAIIRFCIALHSKSSASYNLLRESGFLKLPHPNTVHLYSHFGNPSPGFNTDLVLRVAKDIQLDSHPDHQRNVSIMFDEMKIKAGLVYSVRSGAVVGFVDVGSIGNEILQFETKCRGADVPVASHVLVLMIQGIFMPLRSPIGYYPSLGVSSHQLYPCMWEAIVLLESVGFIVRALVSDGASPNRKLYRMHGPPHTLIHATTHPAAPRKLFFFCDVPHLMKTTRNNWENSGCHNKTRNLHVSFLLFTSKC